MLYNLQLDKKHRHKAKSPIDFMMDKPAETVRPEKRAENLLVGLDISSNLSSGLNNAGEVEARRMAGIHHLSIETYYGAGGLSRILTDDFSLLLVPVSDETGTPNLHPLFTRVCKEHDRARFWIDNQKSIVGQITSISDPHTVDGVQVYKMTIEETT